MTTMILKSSWMNGMPNKKCLVCEIEFYVRPSHWDKRFCCANACKIISMKTKALGANNPNYKNAGAKVCKLCGAPYHSYNKTRKFCSALCANRAMSLGMTRKVKKRKPPPEKIRRPKKIYLCSICESAEVKRTTKSCKDCRQMKHKVWVYCKKCKTEILTYKSRVRKYCSAACRMGDMVGENNPNYIDGRNPKNKKIRNSQEYKIWRISVFERNKYTCVDCGSFGGKLNADHTLPFSMYEGARFNLSNGRTLCINCHKRTNTFLTPKYSSKKTMALIEKIQSRIKKSNSVWQHVNSVVGLSCDFFGFSEKGKVVAIAVHPATKAQLNFIEQVKKAGGLAGVVTSVEEAKKIINPSC